MMKYREIIPRMLIFLESGGAIIRDCRHGVGIINDNGSSGVTINTDMKIAKITSVAVISSPDIQEKPGKKLGERRELG